jgi:4-hydroxy-3-methylbut-2-enyl diphosphate reductase
MVTDRVKGGLVVDLGIRGFVPASHVGSGKIKNLDRYVGQSIPLKVIEVDRERRKVVLSNREATEVERMRQREETLSNLTEGQIRGGIIRRITDYGAFVDLGGIDGLLHISEMSWTRIKHPSEVVKVGDKIQVMVLKLNLDQEKVSLGLRQILPDPWAEVEHRYKINDVIKGHVSRLVPFGAFVQVEGGIEGIIPNSELAVRRVSKPEDVVSVGQEVEVKVIDVRPEERRMTLSLRQLQPQPERVHRERPEQQSYSSYNREEPKTTIGDLVGDMMREARGDRREKKRREREAREAYEDHDEELLEEPMFAPEPVAETPVEVESAATEVVEEPKAEETEVVVAEAPAVEVEEPKVEAEVEVEAVSEVVEEPVAVAEEAAVVETPVEEAVEEEPKQE